MKPISKAYLFTWMLKAQERFFWFLRQPNEKRTNSLVMKLIFVAMNTTKAVVKIKPEKQIKALNKIEPVSTGYGFISSYKPTWWPAPSNGLLAQLVGHCTGIAEVIISNPIQAWIFSGLTFTILHIRIVYYCEHWFHYSFLNPHITYVIFIYSES